MNRKGLLTLVSVAFSLLNGCDNGSGTATVSFENSTGLSNSVTVPGYRANAINAVSESGQTGNVTPEYFGIKLIAVYLSEDIDATGGNTGKTAMIYINPECHDDISGCDVKAGDGINTVIQDYFDFSQPTATVNEVINSQGREVEATTYKYARIEWCKYSDGVETVKYREASMPVDTYQTYNWGGCATAKPIDPPLTVEDGDSVTITLTYDLQNTFNKTTSSTDCTNRSSGCYFDAGSNTLWEPVSHDFSFSATASK